MKHDWTTANVSQDRHADFNKGKPQYARVRIEDSDGQVLASVWAETIEEALFMGTHLASAGRAAANAAASQMLPDDRNPDGICPADRMEVSP